MREHRRGDRRLGTPSGDTRIGVSVTRREDGRLLTGGGCFIADRKLPDEARAVIVRSPHASAAIVDIDCDRARCMPGVIAICTARDLDADRVGGLPWLVPPPLRKAGGLCAPEYLLLCRERVRYVGDAVALVVADSLDQAVDAAEQVHVNLVPADRIPFKTALDTTYDSGDFGAALERALTLADWNGFEARREESRRRGRLRGIGLASHIERAGGGLDEAATVELDADGHATVYLGTMATGQGHDTAYAQIVCNALGLEWEEVSVVQGDTKHVPSGRGSFGSRSLPVGGSALWLALQEILRQARNASSEVLEVNEIDMAFAEGWFHVRGTDRRVHLREVAKAAHESPRYRRDGRLALSAEERFHPREPTYPNGCHVCEVEIDPETGEVTLQAYTAVDDFGNEINPAIVDGQVHGGIAQGIGQALMEHTRYDPATGQLFSGTLLDYRLPRADDLTPFVLARESSACRNNPLGVKGCGEAGAIAAPPAVMNAVMNALSDVGISNLDMPATPVEIWSAIRAARDRQ